MELLSITLTGYKRFKSKTSLQTGGKLVALLGPNEAGKSSLLDAIVHLGHAKPISVEEQSRDGDPANVCIVGRFFLNEAELAAAKLPGSCSMIVTKKVAGNRTFGFEPAAPDRDVSHREPLASALIALIARPSIAEHLVDEDEQFVKDATKFAEQLNQAGETLKPGVAKSLEDLLGRLDIVLEAEPDKEVYNVVDRLRAAMELEAAPTPLDVAFTALKDRLPQFLLFDEDARDLASDYSLSDLRSAIPPALANLAEVADLDFARLFAAIDAGQTDRVTTIERRASVVLSEKFRAAWRQSGLQVALRIQGDSFQVQIVNGETEFTRLAERSDGLRQFVALQMFATRNHVDQPVLLIDEAEQRLHYDAQADLVQMLARQQLAPKVIYTTHSAGCLPEDLGNGVRTVVPTQEDGSSRIVNRFWGEGGRGLSPVLIGLGASTMAFFPTRRAVMVEGASDMLLYPTLFREALGLVSLGFQFVPGLSQMGEDQMLAEGAGVLYLVDADPGGRSIEARLLGLRVPPADIHVLRNKRGSALELEDFVREDRLVGAANAILEKWHPATGRILSLDSDGLTRMGALERAFAELAGVKLPKTDLAYELIGLLGTDPRTELLDPRRVDAIRSIARAIVGRFERA